LSTDLPRENSIEDLKAALRSGASDQDVGAVVDGLLDDTALTSVESLRLETPRLLEEQALDRAVFEERLKERWGPALDLFEVTYLHCREMGAHYHDELTEMFNSQLDLDELASTKHQALALLHARGCMVASEVYALLRTGHGAGAQGRWRTLHEIAVVATTLGENPPEISDRYFRHRAIGSWKEACAYQEHCADLGEIPFTPEEMDEMKQLADSARDEFEEGFETDWGWAKPLFRSERHVPKFDQLAKLAGLDHNRPIVNLSQHAIHAGPAGALDVWSLYGREQVMLAGSSNADLALPGRGSLAALNQTTVTFLLHGYGDTPSLENLVILKVIGHLVDDASRAFAECEQALLEEEARLAAVEES
jgi:hypothetical protein